MRNYVTSGGLLQEGDDLGNLYAQGKMQRDAQLESVMPFVPQNQQELVMMQRTMIPAGQNEIGQPQFTTPEKAIYDQNKIQMQQLQGKAGEDFDRKVNNPLFKLGDFAADVARNTIGAPINFLTDGVGFQMDPSKSAVEGYKKRLQDLDQLQELNAKSFYGGRDARAMAFEGAVTDRNNSIAANRTSDPSLKTSGTPKPNSDGFLIQPYADSSSKVITDVNGEPVKMLDKSAISYIAGVPYRYDPVTQDMEPAVDVAEAQKLSEEAAFKVQFAKGQETYFKERPMGVNVIEAEKARFDTVSRVIENARTLLQNATNAGWGGLLEKLPDSSQKALAEYLQTLRGNVGFAKLQEMRNNSPTGGALGNVSDTEISLLQSVLGSLDQKNSAAMLLETFDTIIRTSERSLNAMDNKIANQDFYYKYEGQSTAPTNAQPPNIGSSGVQQSTKVEVDDETRKILDELGMEPE
tara:strand:- start:1896 stop:3290 length:1395 start_codon:yes stop_codon:yes gene_type:complete